MNPRNGNRNVDGHGSGQPERTTLPAEEKVPWLHTFPARVVYYLLYAPTIYACGQTVRGVRLLLSPDPSRGPRPDPLNVLGWGLAFVVGFGSLALFLYEDSRWKGRLARRNRLFEAILRLGTPPNERDAEAR